jgi:hypothetical protein
MRSFLFGLAVLLAALGPAISSSQAADSKNSVAQQIAKDLKDSGQLKDYRVGVKYEDGVAWLMGTVKSEEQKQLAEQIASNSDGVSHVVNRLEVEAAEELSLASQPASYEQPAPVKTARASAKRPAGNNMPKPYAYTSPQGNIPVNYNQASYCPDGGCPQGMAPGMGGGYAPSGAGAAVSYDNPQLPGYAWPSYAASPNYAAVTYPQQYSASAWPYIGPFYPYPQVPLGWRKVTLEWDDGWWFLDFKDCKHCR